MAAAVIPELDYPDVSADFVVMAGLDPAIQFNLEYLVFFWMAASKGGHDDGIGGNIPLLRSRLARGLAGMTVRWRDPRFA